MSAEAAGRRPRERLTLGGVTEAAIGLVDTSGFEALSLSSLAAELGVRPSALYTYVEGLDGLRYTVAVASTENLTVAVRNAAIGTAGDDALEAIGGAYRGFALGHPGQFASTLLPPRAPNDDLARANRGVLDVFVLVYGAMGLEPDRAHLAARSTRSAIHGFLALEHTAGSTATHDAEYQHLLETLRRGLG
ncbi:MAG: TetR-like C-terminal domain-containing protein [Actinomycetota bacterium]|nr:TetR-like C-terminal domain-containing protein [Actinomycetota bacterium]